MDRSCGWAGRKGGAPEYSLQQSRFGKEQKETLETPGGHKRNCGETGKIHFLKALNMEQITHVEKWPKY